MYFQGKIKERQSFKYMIINYNKLNYDKYLDKNK